MLEIAPQIYVAPRMKKSVRERLWNVMLEWSEFIPEDGGVLILWKSKSAPSGLGMRILGWPKKEFIDYEGIWLTHRSLISTHDTEELEQLLEQEEPSPKQDDPEISDY